MTAASLRARLEPLHGLCLTVAFYGSRFQAVVHTDSLVNPAVEGLPLPDLEEAIEHALRCAERAKQLVS